MTTILVSIISTLGVLLAAKITRDGYIIRRNKKRSDRKDEEYLTKAQGEMMMRSLISKLRHHYNASHVLLYYFHNGERVTNGYSFYKISCLLESYNKTIRKPKKQDHQNLPLMLLAGFLEHYKTKGIVKYYTKETFEGDIDNIETITKSEGIDSTYSYVFKDLDGNTVCNLVMNFCQGPVKVEDFELFLQIGTSCASLMTNHFK